MPEYLTPAVYVEETSFRSQSIEGVATSTVGMAGVSRYGPLSHILTIVTPPPAGAPAGTQATTLQFPVVAPPPLITSFSEFQRAFGGLGDVKDDTNYLAYAARWLPRPPGEVGAGRPFPSPGGRGLG